MIKTYYEPVKHYGLGIGGWGCSKKKAREEEEEGNQPKVVEFVELSVAHRTHQKRTSIRLQIAT